MCFFFNVESGCDAFLKTASLSQKTFVGPSKGTPNILNLYRNDSICSTAVFIAMNSLPKVLVSTVFSLLLYQMIGTRFRNINIPVCDLRVTLSPAWSESTKVCRHWSPTRWWHVARQSFLCFPIEVVPVVFLEGPLINLWVLRIKEQVAFWVSL